MDFKGLKVKIPPKLPASFSYRFAKIARLEEKGQLAAGEAYELVERIVGEKQLDAIADHVDTLSKTKAIDVGLSDFLICLVVEYGTEPGESSASGKS